MRICVVGAGAIGGVAAYKLALAGHSVCVLARGAHLQAIQAQGLVVRAPSGEGKVRLPASDSLADFGLQDLIIIGLKSQQIGPLLPQIQSLLHADSLVLPAINGLPWWYSYEDAECARRSVTHIQALDPQGEMNAALDLQHVIGCVVHAAAQVIEPGVIQSNGQDKLVIGEPSHQSTPRVQALSQALSDAGFSVKLSARIRDEVWMKLIGNASFNPVAALTRARMNELNASQDILQLIRRIMEEVIAVTRAYGCDPLVGVDERIAIGRSIGPVKVSMLQDLELGRELELAAIVRAPLELGLKAQVPMPFTQSVLALAQVLDAKNRGH